MLHPGDGVAIAHRGEFAVLGGQRRLRDALNGALVVAAVVCQLLDGNHGQVMGVSEATQLPEPRHVRGVVLGDDLAQRPHRCLAGQARKIHRCFGMAGALEDATCLRPQRDHVAGPGKGGGGGGAVGKHCDSGRARAGGDAGGACGRVDGDRVGGAVEILVVGHHRRQLERGGALVRHGHADVAGRVAHREGHELRCCVLGGEDEVALVFPVLAVHHDNGLTCADGGDGLLDRIQRGVQRVEGSHSAQP